MFSGATASPCPRAASPPARRRRSAAAQALGGSVWVVKAQVHAGGRGKAGGVKVVRDLDSGACRRQGHARHAARHEADRRRRAAGRAACTSSPARDIEREIYLSLTLNRERGRIAVIASAAGGMDIEEVAEHTPEKILTVNVDPAAGLQPYQCRKLAFGLGLQGKQVGELQAILMALYKLYQEKDASLVEVNPLIVTKAGKLVALDAKINIDANALFRHPDLAKLRDASQEDPMELQRERARPQLRLARRQHRLHGERRGPRHGHDGPHQAARRRAGELPRRRRRRHRRARHRGVRADPLEPEGARHPREHLRRHRALRPHRRRHHQGREEGRRQGAGGRAPRRHERAEGARNAAASSGLAITAAADLTDAARKVVALAARTWPSEGGRS